MTDPGLVTELKEAVTALMAITIIASVYGGVRSKEVNKVLPAFFAFAAISSIALWASAILGINLLTPTASTGNTVAYYATVAWLNTVFILLILTLGAVIVAIIAINEIFELRSIVTDIRIWTGREAELWLPAAVARAIASSLKDEIKELYTMMYIYAVITAAYGFYIVFLTHR